MRGKEKLNNKKKFKSKSERKRKRGRELERDSLIIKEKENKKNESR